jgi:hypothetical protein
MRRGSGQDDPREHGHNGSHYEVGARYRSESRREGRRHPSRDLQVRGRTIDGARSAGVSTQEP